MMKLADQAQIHPEQGYTTREYGHSIQCAEAFGCPPQGVLYFSQRKTQTVNRSLTLKEWDSWSQEPDDSRNQNKRVGLWPNHDQW